MTFMPACLIMPSWVLRPMAAMAMTIRNTLALESQVLASAGIRPTEPTTPTARKPITNQGMGGSFQLNLSPLPAPITRPSTRRAGARSTTRVSLTSVPMSPVAVPQVKAAAMTWATS
ncbi:hypothetical protein D3C72_792090 [compost metagenome]